MLGGSICAGIATCAGGAVIMAKGADNLQAGLRGTDSIAKQSLVKASGSAKVGTWIDAGLDLGTSVGGLARSVPKINSYGSPSRQLFNKDYILMTPAYRQTTNTLLIFDGTSAVLTGYGAIR